MAFLGDRVLDLGLNVLDTEASHFHICSSEPATFAAVAGASLGNKVLVGGDIGAPSAGSPNGRQVTVAALTGGSVTATGTATHYAIVDQTNSRLLAVGSLSPSQGVTSGNTWSLSSSVVIRIPSVAA